MTYVKKHKIVFKTISSLLYFLQHAVFQSFTATEIKTTIFNNFEQSTIPEPLRF